MTIIHYTLNNWEEFENSSIYEGVFEDGTPVIGTGFAGSQFYLDIPRESIGIIGTKYVSLDGTCDIIGEGVDEPYLEKVAIIGPFTDEEGTAVCAYVVYATEHGWTDDEFEVTLVDGIEENNLNVQVTIVSEDNIDSDDDDDDYNDDDDDYNDDDDDYYDEDVIEIWSNEDEARQSEGWTYMSELIEVIEFDGGNGETLDIEIMI